MLLSLSRLSVQTNIQLIARISATWVIPIWFLRYRLRLTSVNFLGWRHNITTEMRKCEYRKSDACKSAYITSPFCAVSHLILLVHLFLHVVVSFCFQDMWHGANSKRLAIIAVSSVEYRIIRASSVQMSQWIIKEVNYVSSKLQYQIIRCVCEKIIISKYSNYILYAINWTFARKKHHKENIRRYKSITPLPGVLFLWIAHKASPVPTDKVHPWQRPWDRGGP